MSGGDPVHSSRPSLLRLSGLLLIAALLEAPGVSPAFAQAEQVVFTLVDEPAPWEFVDPCTGVAVHGTGLENGLIRVTDTTDLGDPRAGTHTRVQVNGTADLFDSDDNLVGTWTYRLVNTDQIPPDLQGAVHFTASGPVTYLDGRTAILHVSHHHVFDKGDVEKFPARDTAVCGGGK
jgi:hypothetical protein